MNKLNKKFFDFLDTLEHSDNNLMESVKEGFGIIFEATESLISLGDLKTRIDKGDQDPGSDLFQCRKFKEEWNKRYPNYPVMIKSNPHDFGKYYDIQISDNLFEKSFDDEETFPGGIEDASGNLADELGLDY